MLNNKREYIYSYDYKNRLVKVEKIKYKKNINGTEINEIEEIVKIIQYRYDNLDRRIQKIFNNGSYRNYYYSNKDIILEENYTKKDKIKTSKYFINGNNIDDVLVMEKIDYKVKKIKEEYTNKKGKIKTKNIRENYTETNLYYYHKNHLNSIIAITDNLGNIIEEYEYDVFGKPYSVNQKTGKITNLKKSSIGNTRLFTGREYERGLQLYYNRARYYNPLLSRFISRDPIDISDDVNLYSYVGNNPLSFVDLIGLAKSMTADEFRVAFIEAYDDYLSTKSRLEHKENIYSAGQKIAGNNPYKNIENQFLKLREELKEKEEIVKQMHYDRNIYNDVSDGFTIFDAQNNGWEKLSNRKSILHQINIPENEWNQKWVSSDGKQEAVFHYKTGELILDETNMGTYNFYSSDDFYGHINYDVNPYKQWGNGLNDISNINQRSAWTRKGVINATK